MAQMGHFLARPRLADSAVGFLGSLNPSICRSVHQEDLLEETTRCRYASPSRARDLSSIQRVHDRSESTLATHDLLSYNGGVFRDA